MGMGFVLPFALVFVAIPLETFVHSLRTVVGLTGIALLQVLALLLRLLGNASRHLGALAQRAYDLALFVPLWIERRTHAASRGAARTAHTGEADAWREART
jgi:hypothetical protein